MTVQGDSNEKNTEVAPEINSVSDSSQPVIQSPIIYTPPMAGPLPYPFEDHDRPFAYIMLALGILYPFVCGGFYASVGRTVWLALLMLFGGIYLKKSGAKPQKGTLLTTVLLAGLVASYSVSTAFEARALCDAAVLVLLPLWLCGLAGTTMGDGLEFYDYINSALRRPFRNFPALVKCTRQKGAGAVWLGIIVAIPFVVIAVSLLSADQAFGGLLNRIFAGFDSADAVSTFFKILFGIGVGVFLFGALYGSLCRRSFCCTREHALRTREALQKLPTLSAIIVLSALSLVYLLYIFSQTAYFFSAFSGILPNGYSAAEYARSGFFEFCALGFVNVSLVMGMKIFTKPSKTVKGLMLGISAFSLLLCTTVMAKLFIYIQSYGLTMLRLSAAVATLMEVTVLVCLMLSVALSKKTAKGGLAVLAAIVLAFAWSDPEYQIAKYNISQYEKGNHQELDINYLVYELGGSSYEITLPYIAQNPNEAQQWREQLLLYLPENAVSSTDCSEPSDIYGLETVSLGKLRQKAAMEKFIKGE